MSLDLDRRQFARLLASAVAFPSVEMLREGPSPSRPARAIKPPGSDFLKSLPETMAIAGVPGIGIGIVHDRSIAWQHHAGVMDTATKLPVTAETMWPAASLSKPVFAWAVLRLVDEGKLDLDKPLRDYVPSHAPQDARGDRITARHVLSHSSGLRNWRNRADQPLVPDFEPAARFQYSGEGFYYLQRAVEQITGRGFEQFMNERLLGPLGMKSSTYLWNAAAAARLVSGHDQMQVRTSFAKDLVARLVSATGRSEAELAAFRHEEMAAAMDKLTPPAPALPNNMVPNVAGSLLTTVGDYAAFLVEVLNGGNAAVDLAAPTRDRMLAPHTRINSALSWGLGWGLEQSPKGTFIWHWGDNGAWKNFVMAHPETRSAIVVLTNGSRGLNIARRLLTAATGEERSAFLWL
jgi:CubicO group peptidase (beta-lactamase class C family)